MTEDEWESPRVVLDTNVVLSALIFGGARMTAIRDAWRAGSIIPLVNAVTAAELILALTYPKFELNEAGQEDLLADYVPWCETVAIPSPAPEVPEGGDPHDVPFLELAVAGRADFLVTGDRDLLALRDKASFRIISPAEFRVTPGA